MLKMTATSITKPMTRLFNKSLRDNIFPDIWKRANVSPIFKKEDPHLCSNYRSVSLLSVVGKCLEKCVFKYLFNHICDNDLSKFQSGFQPGDGTVRQLVHIYYILSRALDEKKNVVLFLVIFQKLLTVYGIRDCSINLNVQVSQVISIIGSPAICQTARLCQNLSNTRLGVPLLQVYLKARCSALFYF